MSLGGLGVKASKVFPVLEPGTATGGEEAPPPSAAAGGGRGNAAGEGDIHHDAGVPHQPRHGPVLLPSLSLSARGEADAATTSSSASYYTGPPSPNGPPTSRPPIGVAATDGTGGLVTSPSMMIYTHHNNKGRVLDHLLGRSTSPALPTSPATVSSSNSQAGLAYQQGGGRGAAGLISARLERTVSGDAWGGHHQLSSSAHSSQSSPSSCSPSQKLDVGAGEGQTGGGAFNINHLDDHQRGDGHRRRDVSPRGASAAVAAAAAAGGGGGGGGQQPDHSTNGGGDVANRSGHLPIGILEGRPEGQGQAYNRGRGGGSQSSRVGGGGAPRDLITFLFGSSEAVYQSRAAKALTAALLDIAESKPGPGFINAKLVPGVEIMLTVCQLSMLNHLLGPFFVPGEFQILAWLDEILFLRIPFFTARVDTTSFEMGALIVVSAVLSLLLLVLLHGLQLYYPLFSRAVAFYLRLATGVLFLPVCDAFFSTIGHMAMTLHHHHHQGGGEDSSSPEDVREKVEAGLGVLLFVIFFPFCLVISQNKFDSDEGSDSLVTRRHNRTDLLFLIMKMLIAIGRYTGSVVAQGFINLILFPIIFITHHCTHIYWRPVVNRFYSGVYLVYCSGALTHLIVLFSSDNHAVEVNVELVFWVTGVPLFYLGYYTLAQSRSLTAIRYYTNAWMMDRLSVFDLADNPELIMKFKLEPQLRSATRIGKYAQLLCELGRVKEAKALFDKALAIDPEHPDNLGNYANLLVGLSSPTAAAASGAGVVVGDDGGGGANKEEALALYEKALRRNSQHRHNLESYGRYLAREGDAEALYFFQKSLMTYVEHVQYRDMYANSSDAAFIVHPTTASIMDCNGAAIIMFQATGRSDLCKGMNLLDMMHSTDDRQALQEVLSSLSTSAARTCRIRASMWSCAFHHQESSSVILTATRVLLQDGGGSVAGGGGGNGRGLVHVSVVDVTELRNQAKEMNAQTFQKAASPMVMIDETGIMMQFNEAAVSFFGYEEGDMLGQNLNLLMPEPYRSQHNGYLERFLLTGEAHVIGKQRTVPVVTRDGEQRLCTLKVNRMVLQGQTFFIGILHDVTSAMEALALAESCFSEASTPMIVIDETGTIHRWNACASSTFGYSAEVAVGRNISFLMPEPMRSQHDRFLQRYLLTGERRVIGKARDVPVITAKGKTLLCNLKVNEMLRPTGTSGATTSSSSHGRMFVGLLHDITEAALAKEFVQGVFDVAASPHIVIDDQGAIVQYNRAAVTSFGYSKDEMVGRNISSLMCEPYRSQHSGYMEMYLATGVKRVIGTTGRPVPVLCKDGSVLPCTLQLGELTTSGGARFFVGMLSLGARREEEVQGQEGAHHHHHHHEEGQKVDGRIATTTSSNG